MSENTIQYYNTHAAEFAAATENADMKAVRERFLKYLSPGRKILDAGCGSGRDTCAFMTAGYEVEAIDASEELCRIASEKTGIDVKCRRFEDLEGEAEYDGIWACASLLHVRRDDLPDVLTRFRRLLKPAGVLYASFKYGNEERIKGGRYFSDMDEGSCREMLRQAGFVIKELFITCDVREGRTGEKWVNAIAEKV